MPKVVRTADVSWEGNLARGTGSISGGSGAFADLPYSLATRVSAPEGKTSPDEFVAAAHAGCFTMSLAGELTGRGTPPGPAARDRDGDARRGAGQGPSGRAQRADRRGAGRRRRRGHPRRIVEAAEAGCTISALVRASAEVTVDVRLAGA